MFLDYGTMLNLLYTLTTSACTMFKVSDERTTKFCLSALKIEAFRQNYSHKSRVSINTKGRPLEKHVQKYLIARHNTGSQSR